jgi:phosphate transport system substrate-binding protein
MKPWRNLKGRDSRDLDVDPRQTSEVLETSEVFPDRNVIFIANTDKKTEETAMNVNAGQSRSITRAARIIAPALAFIVLAGPASGTTLVLAGSGTNLPIIRVLAKAFQRSRPGITIDVPASIGSGSGIRAVVDGAIAVGLISRPLKENEKGLGLDVVTYARTPLVIGVHPSVAEEEISFAGIIDIYRGKKRNWQDGGDIIVLTREPGDSTIEMMTRVVPGFREVYAESRQEKHWTVILNDLEMNKTLARIPHAIGFSDLGALTVERHRIKPLRVNGVAPTLRNIQEGKYPLTKSLMFVFHREKLPPAAREFLAFVRSQEGARILRSNGYLAEK